MWPTVVLRKNGSFLKVTIAHGYYNEFEEVGGARTLLMTEGEFIVAIKETLHFWPFAHLPKAFLALAEIMGAVTFDESEESRSGPPRASIPLDERAVIHHCYNGCTVYVPVDGFILGAVSHLADQPILRLKGWDHEQALRQEWQSTIELVGKVGELKVARASSTSHHG